jgi:hypothetical protein
MTAARRRGHQLALHMLVLALLAWAASTLAQASLDPAARFREAGAAARAADYPRALEIYHELAAGGHEGSSLYWNWAQAASARGAVGEALWALERGRDLDPSDGALARELERLRESANLDPAEVAPEPLAAFGRFARRFRLDLVALVLLALSLALHAASRWLSVAAWVASGAWVALGLGLLAAVPPLLGSWARPTAVVVSRGASLLDAASPTAGAIGALREAEVVPILERSGDYVRLEDSSGSRGWARVEDVRPLERPR